MGKYIGNGVFSPSYFWGEESYEVCWVGDILLYVIYSREIRFCGIWVQGAFSFKFLIVGWGDKVWGFWGRDTFFHMFV